MQIPPDWYIHILPGMVLMAAVLPLLRSKTRQDVTQLMMDHAAGSVLLITITAFVIGYAANAIAVNTLRPILNWVGCLTRPEAPKSQDWVFLYRVAEPQLMEAFKQLYQELILKRSIFGVFLLLTITCFLSIPIRRDYIRSRWIISIILLIVTLSLHKAWLTQRADYHTFLNTSLILLRNERDNAQ